MKIVKAADGTIRYQIVETPDGGKRVLSASGQLLGSISNGKTFDSSGRLVSLGEDVSSIVD